MVIVKFDNPNIEPFITENECDVSVDMVLRYLNEEYGEEYVEDPDEPYRYYNNKVWDGSSYVYYNVHRVYTMKAWS